MYAVGCVFVVMGYLPDVILRSMPWDESLLEGHRALMIVLGQFFRPVVFSVIIPLIAIYTDARVKKGFVESVKSTRCFFGLQGYMS